MKQVQKPKKPMIFYYVIALIVILLLNLLLFPRLLEPKVTEVDYGKFLQMVDNNEISEVQIQSNEIIFSDKSSPANYYKTGVMNDYKLVDRLYEAGITEFGTPIIEQMSPLMEFLLTWVIPIVVMVALGQWLMKRMTSKMMGGMGNAMSFGKSNAKVYVQSETGIKFADVAGEDEAKEILQEIVDFLHNPKKYEEIGAKMPKGALLVGPPGTGKTSIARSIARALNKKYVRISLGGVRDEAEIRGHRKTYVGAMPGRIAEGIRQAGVKNPVMLLDEVDKVSSDYKGDTASALLEVLDGEQNINFRDHYLEVPMDLSEVFFIATANDLSPIPKPLLDRMEIIELSSYTENEKFHIAENYLIKKQRKLSGLTKKQVSISEEVVREVIHSYTREAGVRNLERTIGQLMHKAARKIVEGEREVDIKKKSLKELLGPAPFEDEDENLKPQIGVVRGLAWTSVGGDTLSIEVNVMPGKGKMELTGCMGDVMKESAQIGLSYVRSIAEAYGIDSDYFEKHDIHLHIPEGAVPKDGPSAGITMALAILSAITEIPVRGDIAMTGEITLRGKVLPIGGLKEKLLAAKIIGVKEVLVPARNKRNVAELDEEIISGLKITYVEEMNEVIKCALKKESK